jgi:hypothetical protein
VGKTPCAVAFDRKCAGLLSFECEDYLTKFVDVDKVLNIWFLPPFNFLPIMFFVDILSSSQGKYPSDPITVQLEPVGQNGFHDRTHSGK